MSRTKLPAPLVRDRPLARFASPVGLFAALAVVGFMLSFVWESTTDLLRYPLPAAALAFFGWRWFESRKLDALLSRAVLLLQRGEGATAQRILEEVLRRSRWHPRARILANCRLGLFDLEEGRFEASLEHFGAVERDGRRTLLAHVYEGVPSLAALCFALQGWLDEADGALKEQTRRRTLEHTMSWVPALAVIGCRRGRASEVASALEQDWRAVEGSLPGGLLRMLRVVRAFAADQAGRGSSELLADLDPDAALDEGWTRKWPDLRAWLEAVDARSARLAR